MIKGALKLVPRTYLWSLREEMSSWKSLRYLFLFLLAISAVIPTYRATSNYTSAWDEHQHLSYVQYVTEFKWPAPGYPMNTWGRQAFACHPHHLYGPMALSPCGVDGPGYNYPTGGASTAESWPPGAYVIIATLSAPFHLLFADPLFAVRAGVVLTWSLGTALIGIRALRSSRNLVSTTGWVLALSSLPATGYFSSFVSPYCILPLVCFYSLWLFDQAENFFSQCQPRSKLKLAVTGLGFLMFPFALMFSIPHSISIVIAVSFAIFFSSLLHFKGKPFRQSVQRFLVFGTISFFLVFLARWAHNFYNRVNASRSIPWPVDTVPDAGASPLEHDPNWIYQIVVRAWNFFPMSLNDPLPNSYLIEFVVSLLTVLIVALIVGSSLGILQHNELPLAAGILVSSPIAGLLFYYALNFEPPPRYGIALSIFSIAICAKIRTNKISSVVILILAIALGVLALSSPQIYLEQPCWMIGDEGFLEVCT